MPRNLRPGLNRVGDAVTARRLLLSTCGICSPEFQGVPSDPGAIWSYFIGCGRVDYTFLSQQRTFSVPLTNSANFFRA